MSRAKTPITGLNHTSLTAKQEHFARLIALDGLNQSDAYRQAYNVGPDTPGTTYWDDASELARHPLVSPRIAELKASLQAAAVTDASKVLADLAKAAHGEATGPLRWADKVAALDKIAKILGLYKDQDARNQAPAAITQVVVMLHSGKEDRMVIEQAKVETPVNPEG
jgi:hypothetical protein